MKNFNNHKKGSYVCTTELTMFTLETDHLIQSNSDLLINIDNNTVKKHYIKIRKYQMAGNWHIYCFKSTWSITVQPEQYFQNGKVVDYGCQYTALILFCLAYKYMHSYLGSGVSCMLLL